MTTTTERCPKCKFGKLWANAIINSMGGTDGYKVECPITDCGYRGYRETVSRDKSLDNVYYRSTGCEF